MAKKKEDDREGMIIGGTTLMGLGTGFIFLEDSALLFVASLMIGIGLGLVLSSFVIKK